MGEPAKTHEEIEEQIREIQARKSSLAKANGEGELSSEDRVPFSASSGVMDRDIYGSVRDKFSGYVDSIAANDELGDDDDDYDMSENGSFATKNNRVEAAKQFFEEVVDKDHDPLAGRRVPRVADQEDSEAKSNRRRRWDQPAPAEEPPAKKSVDFHAAQTKFESIDEDVSSDWLETLRVENHCEIENKPVALNHWIGLFESWSNKERLAALEYLIASEICDAGQIRHLYSLIEPQLQRDFISLLPKELALYVLHFLGPKDLLKAAQTCRTWRILCEDNLLWREKCQEEGLLGEGEFLSSASGFNRSSSSSSSSHHNLSHDNVPFIRSEYKRGYLRLKTIEHNWRFGRFPNDPSSENAQPPAQHPQPQIPQQPQAPVPVPVPVPVLPPSQQSQEPKVKHRMLKDILHLKGHDDHVITCLQFNPESNLIVSGSDDNTLKVWSSTTGKCLRTLTGHTGGVWSSQLSPNNIVISGSTDRTLKIWDALSGRCKHTLYGHTSTVRCMALHGNQVVSGSRDTTLRVWDINTGNCDHVLVGHCAAVRCVQFNGKIVVSGAYDYLVKVWDAKTETCLHTLDGHNNRVYSLQFDGENIVSGSLDTSIRVWSASTGQSKHILTGHQSLTSGMQLRGNVLVSGNADSTVKVWDINTGECLATLAGEHKHQSAVTCLQFNSKFVITSSDDGTVKLWDLATGEFIRNLVTLSSGGSGGVVWRIRASHTKLVCAVGSRNGTEETKLLVLDFDTDDFNLPQQETPKPCPRDLRSIGF